MTKILLLEDDKVLAESLIDLLEFEKFAITHVDNGEAVLDYTFKEKFGLYLFDVNVADIDGFSLVKSLRESGDETPVIFLTALSDINSLAKGFDVGANDYIKKPFEFDELLIRINALLKRHSKALEMIEAGEFYFDLDAKELYKNQTFIPLSAYELKLVELFFNNLNKTLPKELLLDELSYDREVGDGSLRVYINKLRKLDLPIQTIKGVGYRLGTS
ncbi:MAG: response regulator transcription factor [Sulfurimonas sp.]